MSKLSVQQALAKGKSYAKAGKFDEAKALYAAILQAFPNNTDAQRGLAALSDGLRSGVKKHPPQPVMDNLMSLYKQGKLETVVEQAKDLTVQYPKAINLWSLLGASAGQLGRLDLALHAFKCIVTLNPNQAVAHFNMGNVLKDQGQLEEAIDAYNYALSIKPDYEAALNNVVVALKSLGKNGEKRIEETLQTYNEAKASRTEQAFLYFKRANDLQAKGKLKDAINAYSKALAIKPDHADSHYNMGLVLNGQGKLEEALEAYTKALDIKPDHADAYNNMGVALNGQGKLEEALEAYTKALDIKPDHADAYNNMGVALNGQGKLEGALEAYTKALAIKPDHTDAYNNMGITFADQGKLEEAVEAYNKDLAIKPDSELAARNLVNLPLGSIDEKTILGLNEQFSIICSNIEDRSQRLFFEGNLLSHNGDYDAAFKKFVEANCVRSKEVSPEIRNLKKSYDKISDKIQHWSPRPLNHTEPSLKKLFLLGPSRSGKSSLEKLLMRIPKIFPMYESIDFSTLHVSDRRIRKVKSLDMTELFYHDEKNLLDHGYSFATSTSPENLFYIDQLLDSLANSFFILVKRDRTDISSEIFTREYRKRNFYSYTHSSIQNYLNFYSIIWEEIKRKAPQRTIEIDYEDVLTKPKEVLNKINQFTGETLILDKVEQYSTKKRIAPFREHYAQKFKL